MIFIAVGTPSLPNGEASLEYLEAAAHGIGAAMDGARFRVVVNKSTVPVGSGNLVETLVQEGIRAAAPTTATLHPFRRGQQPGVSARGKRGIGFAVSGPDCGGRIRRSYAGGDAGGVSPFTHKVSILLPGFRGRHPIWTRRCLRPRLRARR